MGCYMDAYGNMKSTISGYCEFVNGRWIDPNDGSVTTQTTTGGTTTASGIKINTQVGGVQVTSGQTTLDKILATITSLAAIGKGAGYVPTSVHPQTAPTVIYGTQPGFEPGGGAIPPVGAQFGDSIQRFITENTGLLLVGGVMLVLWRSGRR
jgi:hypothetical protein